MFWILSFLIFEETKSGLADCKIPVGFLLTFKFCKCRVAFFSLKSYVFFILSLASYLKSGTVKLSSIYK